MEKTEQQKEINRKTEKKIQTAYNQGYTKESINQMFNLTIDEIDNIIYGRLMQERSGKTNR